RGGDADGDSSKVQMIRMPVFTLKAALSQPDIYKGRYVIIRGKLTDVKVDAKSATAMLDEVSMKAADLTRTGQDMGIIESRYNRLRFHDEHHFAENVMNPTGRKVLGRLPEADPFLEPDKEFVFVGRFDGAKPSNDEQKVALPRSASPMRNASSAGTRRAVRIMSRARPSPTRRGRRTVPPPPGMIPMRVSVRPICAAGSTMRRSQARASSQPPPRASPLTAAIQGFGQRSISRSAVCNS